MTKWELAQMFGLRVDVSNSLKFAVFHIDGEEYMSITFEKLSETTREEVSSMFLEEIGRLVLKDK